MKYYSSILAVFKNESHILKEWIEHYKKRGIDKIYLLNDNSSDSFYKEIQDYVDSGYVSLKHTESCDITKTMPWRQRFLYNKYFPEVLEETFWVGIFDLDEFVYSPNNKYISDVLCNYEDYEELMIEWYFFGSSGFIEQPKKVVDSFVQRGNLFARDYNLNPEYRPEWCKKTFAKTKNIKTLCHHFNHFNQKEEGSMGFAIDGFNKNMSDSEDLYANHYLQSKDFYKKRMERGSCNNSNILIETEQRYYEELFNKLDKNELEDTRLKEQNKTWT